MDGGEWVPVNIGRPIVLIQERWELGDGFDTGETLQAGAFFPAFRGRVRKGEMALFMTSSQACTPAREHKGPLSG